jgi:hypothetical protein
MTLGPFMEREDPTKPATRTENSFSQNVGSGEAQPQHPL